MEYVETVEDSFLLLKNIGMEEIRSANKRIYRFTNEMGRGGVNILGDIDNYYFTDINYQTVNQFNFSYRFQERCMEMGNIRNGSGYSRTASNNILELSTGMVFDIHHSMGAKSWFYNHSDTLYAGYSLVLRESFYRKNLFPVIKACFGTQTEPYSVLKKAGSHCIQLIGGILNSLKNCPYEGRAAQLFLDAKVNELLAMLIHIIEIMKETTVIHLSDYEKAAVFKAIEILCTQLRDPPTIDKLSRQVGINPNKLQLGFRLLTGATVMEYLRNYRIEKALELLGEDMLLKEIADQIGYRSQSRFSESFKRTCGILPSQYRKQTSAQQMRLFPKEWSYCSLD
jgi:AraC-like DNA-binding protein